MQNYSRKTTNQKVTCYLNDKNELHRTDGPAVECRDGDKFWYINNKLHRLDGPAIEHSDGYKAWWINNKRHTEKDYKQHPEVLKYKMIQEAKQMLGIK